MNGLPRRHELCLGVRVCVRARVHVRVCDTFVYIIHQQLISWTNAVGPRLRVIQSFTESSYSMP